LPSSVTSRASPIHASSWRILAWCHPSTPVEAHDAKAVSQRLATVRLGGSTKEVTSHQRTSKVGQGWGTSRPGELRSDAIASSRFLSDLLNNLEASVRSRDTDNGVPAQRDLIEAGLNCPACQRRYGCCVASVVARGAHQGAGMGLWCRGEWTIGAVGGGDRRRTMRWTQRVNGAESDPFVIGLRSTEPMQTSTSQFVWLVE
jgi:hypothetical protein